VLVAFAFLAAAVAFPASDDALIEDDASLDRIVNGFPARPNQIPYQVLLKIELPDGSPAMCGGSIISNWHVLSAAHCTLPADRVYLRFGSININDGGITMVVSKSSIVNHPEFNPRTLFNDISIIHLPLQLQFSTNIQPVHLPTSHEAGLTHVNTYARVSGWGVTDRYGDSKNYAHYLRFVDLKVISNKECKQYYRGQNQVTERILCAVGPYAGLPNGENQGHCNGDSGGPLVIQTYKGYVQIGVVSFAAQRDCLQKPSGFTRIGWYLDFIYRIVTATRPN